MRCAGPSFYMPSRAITIFMQFTFDSPALDTSGRSLGIIGYGDFGTFVHEFVVMHMPNVAVKIFVPDRVVDGTTFFPLEEVCKTNLLILAVPIASFSQVLDDIKPHL